MIKKQNELSQLSSLSQGPNLILHLPSVKSESAPSALAPQGPRTILWPLTSTLRAIATAVTSVVSDSVRPRPWDSPGNNTGVGCHFLLQCIKVKSESEVAQPCPTLQDPMDCSLPGSSIHGVFQARVLEWGATAFSPLWVEWAKNQCWCSQISSKGKTLSLPPGECNGKEKASL